MVEVPDSDAFLSSKDYDDLRNNIVNAYNAGEITELELDLHISNIGLDEQIQGDKLLGKR